MARIGLQKGIKKADPKRYPFLFFYIGRGERIRTFDILLPKQALYQTELHPETTSIITAFLINANFYIHFVLV